MPKRNEDTAAGRAPERCAYHEAGHAVAHYTLGHGTVYGITIIPNEATGNLGSTNAQDMDISTPEDVENEVICLYAGAAAEVRFDPGCRDEILAGAEGDDEQAADWLASLGYGPQDEARLRERAAALVDDRWPQIDALARELLKQQKLEMEEVEYIIEGDLESLAYCRRWLTRST